LLLVPLPSILRDRWAEKAKAAAAAAKGKAEDDEEEQSAAALSLIRGLAGAMVAGAASASGDDGSSDGAAARAETLALSLTQTVAAVATNGMWKRVPMAEERLAQLEAVYRMRMMHDSQERRGVWRSTDDDDEATAVAEAAAAKAVTAAAAQAAAGSSSAEKEGTAGVMDGAVAEKSMGVGWKVARCVSAKASAWGGSHFVYGTIIDQDEYKNFQTKLFEDDAAKEGGGEDGEDEVNASGVSSPRRKRTTLRKGLVLLVSWGDEIEYTGTLVRLVDRDESLWRVSWADGTQGEHQLEPGDEGTEWELLSDRRKKDAAKAGLEGVGSPRGQQLLLSPRAGGGAGGGFGGATGLNVIDEADVEPNPEWYDEGHPLDLFTVRYKMPRGYAAAAKARAKAGHEGEEEEEEEEGEEEEEEAGEANKIVEYAEEKLTRRQLRMAVVRCKRALYPPLSIAPPAAAVAAAAATTTSASASAALPSLLPRTCDWARPVSWWEGVEQSVHSKSSPPSPFAMSECALDWELVRGAVRQGAPVGCVGLGSQLAAQGVNGPRNVLFDAIRADPALRFSR
jgi:hypothetical protein